MAMKNGNFTCLITGIVLFILGLSLFFFPFISNIIYSLGLSTAEDDLYESIKEKERGKLESSPAQMPDPLSNEDINIIENDSNAGEDLDKDLAYLRQYNRRLWEGVCSLTDLFVETDALWDQVYLTEDEDKAKIFAYITIDRLGLTLPIYLGASKDHLDKGAALIKGTSLPVGGPNTNAVIAAHAGRVKKLFSDIKRLEAGDHIRIRNRWETLHYQVTGNKIIWPDQVEYLSLVEDRDMVTLLTCYHESKENDRLIVFAQRYYPEQQGEDRPSEAEEAKVQAYEKQKGTIVDTYSYLTTTELSQRPWHLRIQSQLLLAVLLLSIIFLFRLFKR